MNRLPATVGWASHAPVQINVARDLHITGGAMTSTPDVPDDCVRPATGFVAELRRLWSVARLVGSAVWFVAKALFWVVVGALALCVVLPAAAIALCFWILARIAELLLWAESRLGGGPTKLAYLPTLQRSSGRDLWDENGLEAKQLEAPVTPPLRRTSASLAVRGHDV
jgi:hypothetical protein